MSQDHISPPRTFDRAARSSGAALTHTPGPWTTHPARDGSGDIGIKSAGPQNIHAECFAEFWRAGEFCREEAEANARLISAAPDLLEALKALVHPDGFDVSPENLAAARAAILKAEGRDQ